MGFGPDNSIEAINVDSALEFKATTDLINVHFNAQWHNAVVIYRTVTDEPNNTAHWVPQIVADKSSTHKIETDYFYRVTAWSKKAPQPASEREPWVQIPGKKLATNQFGFDDGGGFGNPPGGDKDYDDASVQVNVVEKKEPRGDHR